MLVRCIKSHFELDPRRIPSDGDDNEATDAAASRLIEQSDGANVSSVYTRSRLAGINSRLGAEGLKASTGNRSSDLITRLCD